MEPEDSWDGLYPTCSVQECPCNYTNLPPSIQWLQTEPKVEKTVALKKAENNIYISRSCIAAACFEPGDCIFTAGLTAVAFHSGDRW